MSWPTDGKPRFAVTELRGGSVIALPATAGRGWSVAPTEFYVLDRAYCHKTVARFLHRLRETDALSKADTLCAELNAA